MKESNNHFYEISGTCFFDYNGNGVHDYHEPQIGGAMVKLDDLRSTTDSKGRYCLKKVTRGLHKLFIKVKKFSHISFSLEAFQSIELGIEVDVKQDSKRDIGLMQGFLTVPLDLNTDSILFSHTDLDHRIGHIRNWAGDNTPAVVFNHEDWCACVPGTFDQHQGTDWAVPIGTPILSAAPGIISGVRDDPKNVRLLQVLHDTGTKKFVTEYGHISEVHAKIGEKVRRGEVIALSGADAGEGRTTNPHVHMNLFKAPLGINDYGEIFNRIRSQPDLVIYKNGDWVKLVIDPYHDLSRVDSENYWTKYNDPQFAAK